MRLEIVKTLKLDQIWYGGQILDDQMSPIPDSVIREFKSGSDAVRRLPDEDMARTQDREKDLFMRLEASERRNQELEAELARLTNELAEAQKPKKRRGRRPKNQSAEEGKDDQG